MIKISIQKKLKMAGGITTLVIDTEIESRELVTVFGRSGAGKTTLLRMVAGLLQPEKGRIEVNGKVWLDTEKKISLPVQERRIGFVFQEPALFPNMSVRQNLQYAAGKNAGKDRDLVERLLKMVDMEELADRKPGTLSGGQQQRIAMIRALASRPELLLLDEPFSSLDVEMRHRLRDELHALHREFNLTTLLVTHDMADIYRLADRVVLIDEGKVLRSGKPGEVFGEASVSSKVRLQGEILQISKSGVAYIVEILTGNTVIKVVAAEEAIAGLHPGAKVLVFSKAFNPIIQPI